jgi:hypothetical protein
VTSADAMDLLRGIAMSTRLAVLLQTLPTLRLFPLTELVQARKNLVMKISRHLNGEAQGERAVYQHRGEVNLQRGQCAVMDMGNTIVQSFA